MNEQQNNERFNSTVSEVLPRLKRYVANQLRMAVINGIIGPRKYRPEDISDEVFIQLKERWDAGQLPLKDIKTAMFKLADDALARIMNEEKEHIKNIAIEEILAEEIKGLEEKYSVEADGDIVLYEEFDDISYEHEREQKTIYLLEPGFENDLIETLDLTEIYPHTPEASEMLAHVYQDLPALTSAIIDLHVAGGLSVEEIAEVREMEIRNVDKIIRQVRLRFISVLNINET